jgi:zinc transport system permease protein
MIMATITGAILTILGLTLAYSFNLSSGATIVLVLGAALLINYFIQE